MAEEYKLCDDCEILYSMNAYGHNCPLCGANDNIAELETEVETLVDEANPNAW